MRPGLKRRVKTARWDASRVVCFFLALALITAATARAAAEPGPADFSFVQVSDLHILPRPAGEPAPDDGQSARTIGWICEQVRHPQRLEPSGVTAPPPAFVVATGDLTEYGVIGTTWEHFESLWKPLGVPLYAAAGNHDNTWTTILPILRRRHGGDHYSFDRFGCHFAVLDSASIQEPVPSLEARTLNWLRADLSRVGPDVPVFLFQHHPLGTTEFATPLEQLRFLEVLRGHNVAALCMGHGHGVRAERWNGLDGVMGGSTFGPNAGYSIISVVGGTLRVVYRYMDAAKPMKVLLEKPLAADGRREREWRVDRPAAGAVVSGGRLEVAGRGTVRRLRVCLDGQDQNVEELVPENGAFEGALSLEGLVPGRHFLLTQTGGKNDPWQQATEFLYLPADCKVKTTRAELSAGLKAGPVVTGDGCLVATTDGQIARIHAQGRVSPLLKTGVEVLHAPAVADGVMYFCSGELGVFAAGLDGKVLWTRTLGAAVYGTPAVTPDAVYVGDLEGFVHALDRKTGRPRWSKRHATFSIEMPLVAGDGVLYFGAWDGFVYAVAMTDGALRWKQRGPAGQAGEASLRSRYYAPADCPPVIVGGRLFVCDRSYRLGSYSLEGTYLGLIADGVSAVGWSEDRQGVLARGLVKGLTRYDGQGRRTWTADVPLGRFPCPPTEAGGRVYACSNLGLLSVLDGRDGKVLTQYQAWPRLHVMAPVGADPHGRVYVGGMDGEVLIADCGSRTAE